MLYVKPEIRDVGLRLLQDIPAEQSPTGVRQLLFEMIRLSDGAVVGNCDLRAGESIGTVYAGNIGYEIAPEYRGNRYSAGACSLLLSLARELGMSRAAVCCAPDNLASRSICESLGPSERCEIPLPPWHELYSPSRKSTIQYLFIL